MGTQYCIEQAEYDNGILSVNGWIFHGKNERNEIRQLKLVLLSESGKMSECRLDLSAREDVKRAFELKYNQTGFSFKGKIGSFMRIKVFLVYSLPEGKSRIEITALKGTETDIGKENIRIEYPEFEGYYSIRNFRLLRKEYRYRTERRSVDVIIPVYNGYQYLDRLFTSIYKTELDMHLIVINDCSTDERINNFFNNFCQEHDNITYIENDVNLGFVKSVNKGLRLAKNDVVLVNTDIEVPPYWLERLMRPIFLDKKIASTTPYTNCGTLCSFPEMGKDNKIFDNRSVLFADSIFRSLVPMYTEMPTGVGFCMGMSKNAIERTGLLDEENFSKGYGEENDWCQRACRLGYKNVQVENLFVYHKHGGSFLSEEKEKLLEKNTKRLIQKHPDYMKDTARYFEEDVNKVYRKYALFMCLMQRDAYTVIYFNHALGGGADDYMKKQKKKLLKDPKVKFIEFRYHAFEHLYQTEITYKDYNIKLYSENSDDLFSKLKLSDIDEIFINELVSFPDLYNVLQNILNLKISFHAKVTMLLHDFFCICPTINLLLDNGTYCEMNCESQNCLKQNRYLCDTGYSNIQEWRSHWEDFLKQCDAIIAFSDDTKKKIENIYGKLEGLRVVPHVTDRMLVVSKKYKCTDNINIGVLGVLGRHKGLSIVKEMLAVIEREGLAVNIIVIGTCEEKIESGRCIITGRYTREQLPSLMYLYDIDVIFISSVWPETFSYTADEAMKMKMPVAVFDLGAPAERVKEYEKGIVINKISAEAALKQIMDNAQRNTAGMIRRKKKVLFIIEYQSFSSRYRVDHLRENLAKRGIGSCVVMMQDMHADMIDDYNVVYIYRCSDIKAVRSIEAKAKKLGIRLFYDIDDYIFEYRKIKELEFLKDDEYYGFEKYSGNIKDCMKICDVITTSTNHLAQAIRESFPDKKTIICRNAACLEMQLLSEIALVHQEEKDEDAVTLGYFSGSKTHNQDWKFIEDCIVKIMLKNKNVELLIVGPLEISNKLAAFHDRVRKLPFVRWQELPGIICGVDINLMPLENTFFQWCKSENKWMEAGLVGVPTIASYNPELADVLEDEQNVIFCTDLSEWELKLEELIMNKELRKKIGRNAQKEVYGTHLVTNDENFDEIVHEISVC